MKLEYFIILSIFQVKSSPGDPPIQSSASFDSHTTKDNENSSHSITATSAPTKKYLPEGSTIQVWKPMIKIHYKPQRDVPGELVYRAIKSSATIVAVQGFALERLKSLISRNLVMERGKISITTSEGTRLPSNQNLVEFIIPQYITLFVQYPDEKYILKERKSTMVDLEGGMFSLFDDE